MVLPDAAASALEQAYREERTWMMVVQKCTSCAFDPTRCDLSEIVLCNVAVSLSPVGDIMSIARESRHHVIGQEVDEIDLVLSTIELGAVAIVPLTGGSSLALKAGAGLLKTAYRVGALSDPILAAARRAAKTGIDWSLLAKTRPATFSGDISRAIRPENLAPAAVFVRSAGEIRAVAGTRDALYLISQAENVADARRMSLATRSLKSQTAGAIELVGKSRIFRAIARWSDEIYRVLASAVFFIIAVIGLILSAEKL